MDIEKYKRRTLTVISKIQPDEWKEFLKTAAFHLEFTFLQQMQIFKQLPLAKRVSYEKQENVSPALIIDKDGVVPVYDVFRKDSSRTVQSEELDRVLQAFFHPAGNDFFKRLSSVAVNAERSFWGTALRQLNAALSQPLSVPEQRACFQTLTNSVCCAILHYYGQEEQIPPQWEGYAFLPNRNARDRSLYNRVLGTMLNYTLTSIIQTIDKELLKNRLDYCFEDYLEIKADNPFSIVLYQINDLYYCWDEDAEQIHTLLDLSKYAMGEKQYVKVSISSSDSIEQLRAFGYSLVLVSNHSDGQQHITSLQSFSELIAQQQRFTITERENSYTVWDDLYQRPYQENGIAETFSDKWQAETYLIHLLKTEKPVPKIELPEFTLDYQKYSDLKNQYPHIIGIQANDQILFYHEDAITASELLQTPLALVDIPGWGRIRVCTSNLSLEGLEENFLPFGYHIMVLNTDFEMLMMKDTSQYIPIGMMVRTDENVSLQIASTDFEMGVVTLIPSDGKEERQASIQQVRQWIVESLSEDSQKETETFVKENSSNQLDNNPSVSKQVDAFSITTEESVTSPTEEAPAEFVTETVAKYPAVENRLPYDIVIETIRFDEPKQTLDKETPAHSEDRRNFRITDDALGIGGAKEKFKANMAAIRLLHDLEIENRLAAPEEQEILSRYVGWGGLPQAFDGNNAAWANEYKELKTVLSDEEYRAAMESTLTAFYTPPVVIKAMYEALDRMGLSQGNILEPSCGTGNFIGLLPEGFSTNHVYGVELDSISGRIAAQLYQNADIFIGGYENAELPDNSVDLAVGNVPFGDYQLSDSRYDQNHWRIHDYFFGKTLDKVRPGGIIAFISSKGTMDKKNPDVRKYIARRADLLGAVRLPNTAFQANAGTEVTSDIIFLQKRDQMIDELPEWVNLSVNTDGVPINSYFVSHPEMVLGHMTARTGRYGTEYVCVPDTSIPLEQQLSKAIQTISLSPIPKNAISKKSFSAPLLNQEEAAEIKPYSYGILNGKIYFREVSGLIEYSNQDAETVELFSQFLKLKNCLHNLFEAQLSGFSDEAAAQLQIPSVTALQQQLNMLYDTFTAKYGRINSRANQRYFEKDDAYYLLSSLEVTNEEGVFVRKAPVFSERTIRQHQVVEHTDSVIDALSISVAEHGKIDFPYMEQLTGRKTDEIIASLGTLIYRIPQTDMYVTADEYLSGNIREKLTEAKRAASLDNLYRKNVEALEKVIPEPLQAGEISVRLGTVWIPTKYYKQFIVDVFRVKPYERYAINVYYNEYDSQFTVIGKKR